MNHCTGWLFDLYAHPQKGVVFWLLGDDETPHCFFDSDFEVPFYAAGAVTRLRQLWRFLKSRKVQLQYTQREDLFSGPQDVVEIVRSIAPYWRNGGRCCLITNAGGLNPLGCARACLAALRAAGCTDRTVAAVSGDDVLDWVGAGDSDSSLLRNLDTAEPISAVRPRLVTAHAVEQALMGVTASGLVPLIAHPERYQCVSIPLAGHWKTLGALLQVLPSSAELLFSTTSNGPR